MPSVRVLHDRKTAVCLQLQKRWRKRQQRELSRLWRRMRFLLFQKLQFLPLKIAALMFRAKHLQTHRLPVSAYFSAKLQLCVR